MGTTKDIREAVEAELDISYDADPVDVTWFVQVRDDLDITG